MQRNYPVADALLMAAFALMLFITAAVSWYRFIGTDNFRYVIYEEDTPERLDLSTY